MKIIYFGTPKIAVKTLESLQQEKDLEILAVVTQPDKEVGRKKVLTAPPVKVAAKNLNLKVIQPENKLQLKEALKEFKADFFVVFAYGMIFTKEVLDMPKIAAINIHTSLLPKYRGASPIQEALKNGDKETGISVMKMDEKLDHGDIYLIKRVNIEQNDTSVSLSEKLSNSSAEIMPHALQDIASNEMNPLTQNHEEASYCKKISKEDGEINFKKTAEEISNMIRAYTPWPSVWTRYKDKKIKIIETEIVDKALDPGKFTIEDGNLLIGTSKGCLKPTTLQLEGKKDMDIKSFLNGYKKLFLD